MKINLKKYKNDKVTDIFQHASSVYCTKTFSAQMTKLKNIHLEVYNKLIEVDAYKWSRAYSLVRHYSLITSNITESMNNALRHARKLPVTNTT